MFRFGLDLYDRIRGERMGDSMSDWKVYFTGGYSSKHRKYERAGKEIKLEKRFTWGGKEWYIPSLYVCREGLVLDFCVRIEAQTVLDFIEKWDLKEGETRGSRFTAEQREQIDAENPFNMNIKTHFVINRKNILQTKNGFGLSWAAKMYFPDEKNSERAESIMEHYRLDGEYCWSFCRKTFPWKRKTQLRELTLCLSQSPAPITVARFQTPKVVGKEITFNDPTTNESYTLKVEGVETGVLEEICELHGDREYPTHYVMLQYTMSPAVSGKGFYLTDCADSDRVRIKGKPDATSIAIIGGADHPKTLALTKPEAYQSVAYSALHFKPVKTVEWRAVVQEKLNEDVEIVLI